MDQFQNIKQRIEQKKKERRRVNGEEKHVCSLLWLHPWWRGTGTKSLFHFFSKTYQFYCWNLCNIFCRTSCNKVWTSDEHHSASPPTGSRIIEISFICLHNQSQWNEMSSAFSFHPVFIFSLCLRVAKPTLKEIRKIESVSFYTLRQNQVKIW